MSNFRSPRTFILFKPKQKQTCVEPVKFLVCVDVKSKVFFKMKEIFDRDALLGKKYAELLSIYKDLCPNLRPGRKLKVGA